MTSEGCTCWRRPAFGTPSCSRRGRARSCTRSYWENAVSHVVRRVRPRTIDNSVVFHGLSDLEIDRMAGIIRDVMADTYYVDSCYADAGLFGSMLAAKSGNPHVRAYTKADSRYTVVAAASILAKVARDRSIAQIRRRHSVGSGYPGDKKTAAYLRDVYRATGQFPDFARRSWYTACRIAGDERPTDIRPGSLHDPCGTASGSRSAARQSPSVLTPRAGICFPGCPPRLCCAPLRPGPGGRRA